LITLPRIFRARCDISEQVHARLGIVLGVYLRETHLRSGWIWRRTSISEACQSALAISKSLPVERIRRGVAQRWGWLHHDARHRGCKIISKAFCMSVHAAPDQNAFNLVYRLLPIQ
jgi:hypothetical protein